MNKKDLRELRKNFSESSDLFTMNHIVTAFVDAEKNIRCQSSRAYHDIPEEETDCYWNTLKRVLSGTLGKGLLEYAFPNEAYEEGAPQFLLHQALNTKLEEESAVSLLLDQIANQMEYDSEVAMNKLVSYLEPAMIVVMAAVVGFVIISVIQPIYGSYATIANSY